MIASILDACRDQLCACAAFQSLVGAGSEVAARAAVVRLTSAATPPTTAHAVLDTPRLSMRTGDRLVSGTGQVEGSILFPIPSGQTVDQAIDWAAEAFFGTMVEQMLAWDDDRLLLLDGLDLEPPLLLDAADDLPSWFIVDVGWSWRLAA